MARKPNYNFERSERERIKAAKAAAKAAAKQRDREQGQAARSPDDASGEP
jgi:hypothetical protein